MTAVDGIVVLASDPYPADGPLLWYVRRLGASLGLRVGTSAHDRPLEGRQVVAGHGSASRAAPVAADAGLPTILFSPYLDEPEVADALRSAPAPGLVVGSVADPHWDRRTAAQLTQVEVLQVPDADHLLEIPGDPLASIRVLERVMARCEALLRRLAT